MALYAPLEFINNDIVHECGFETGKVFDTYAKAIFPTLFHLKESEYLSEEAFVNYVLHPDFLNVNAKNPLYVKLNTNLMQNLPMIMDNLGYTEERLRKQDIDASTYLLSDIRDVLIMQVLLDRWARNKQVLKPNPVFAEYLIATDKLSISKDILEHLPFSNFYIDLEDCNKDNFYGNICGIYVDISKVDVDSVAISLQVLSKDMMIFSQYMGINSNEPVKIDTSQFSTGDVVGKVPAMEQDNRYADNTTLNTQAIITIALQLIMYMNVKEPDINPAPEMSHTYRPSTHKIKNKYSEIYKQEVGIKIGKKISQSLAEVEKVKKTSTPRENTADKTHKSPVPHFRCAHWHHYWTGKGRTNYEVRWIEPVFVCGSYDSSVAGNVTIHGVEE